MPRKEITMENKNILGLEERVSYDLMALYESYGYKKYKMSKFEEYDLYLENKNFLKSENVIAFNDPTGKLMALKPDVTLSIAKNTETGELSRKLFYSEHVYRVSGNMHEFKEIPQIGLEFIGCVDTYSLCEVLMLAKASLCAISESYVLDVSHMGLVIGLLDETGLPYDIREEISACIGTKNTPEIEKICKKFGVDADLSEKLCTLASLYGSVEKVLPKAKALVVNDTTAAAVNELSEICEVLKASGEQKNINIDFSVVSDMNYYNGITFRGYIENIPGSILSGGRYDNLLRRMGKNAGAVGFAVYLDLLSYLDKNNSDYDVDVLLVYDEKTPASDVLSVAKKLISEGKTVRVSPTEEINIKYNRRMAIGFAEGRDGK